MILDGSYICAEKEKEKEKIQKKKKKEGQLKARFFNLVMEYKNP